MTKVIILGPEPKEEKKAIEFVRLLSNDLTVFDASCKPNMYQKVELICRKYTSFFDLMFAYNEDRNKGYLYLGHFNDGVVE